MKRLGFQVIDRAYEWSSQTASKEQSDNEVPQLSLFLSKAVSK